jgi:2-polyprenyl-3-methyl-5-hydroxy-6-metoxy-1,4-benzoquinol methylase
MGFLERSLTQIEAANPRYASKLRVWVARQDQTYQARAEEFLARYAAFMARQGRSFEEGPAMHLRLCAAINEERVFFLREGRYQSTSFAEVETRVYGNPEVFESHMHGLVFAQFLWPEQYERYRFFCDRLSRYAGPRGRYLEVGGGHALYVAEAARQLPEAVIDLVDISATSLALAQGIAGKGRISYYLTDIYQFEPEARYDFITMGEVIEHVEKPLQLLRRVRNLLSEDGHAYITTPANAPTIDHIYLFRNAGEIRQILKEAGFRIVEEVTRYAEDVTPERAEKLKIALMYGAIVAPA